MDFLDGINESVFEAMGTIFGLFACSTLLIQLIKEIRTKTHSSISSFYLIGWVLIFLFWALYGIRFRAIALYVTNGIALAIQILLCIVIFRKKARI